MAKEDNLPSNANYEKPEERSLKKTHEYSLFVKWMSLPANLRGMSGDKLDELGLEDHEKELLAIRSQAQFAKRFNVQENVLTNWKRRQSFNEDLIEVGKTDIFQKFFPRVIRAFTMKTLEHGDAARMQTWMNMFANEPTGDVTIETTIKTAAADMDAAEIANMVAVRLKRTRGIDMSKEVEDVEHTEVMPSQQEYDFEEIEKRHRKVEPPKPSNGELNLSAKEKLKAAIAKAAKNNGKSK